LPAIPHLPIKDIDLIDAISESGIVNSCKRFKFVGAGTKLIDYPLNK
jgi:hypothetical protein